MNKLSGYVRRVLPNALVAFLATVELTAEDGLLLDEAVVVKWYNKFDIAVEGRKRFRTDGLMPFSPHASEFVATMAVLTENYAVRPSVFNNVWLSSTPGVDDGLFVSGEIHAACSVRVAASKCVDCFIVQLHKPSARAREAVKPSRPTLDGEAVDSQRQRAALYGGECGRYPVNAYHDFISADVVVLSNTVVVVPVSAVLRRADMVPVCGQQNIGAYDGHETLGRVVNEHGNVVDFVRPLMLRGYPRLSSKRLLDM